MTLETKIAAVELAFDRLSAELKYRPKGLATAIGGLREAEMTAVVGDFIVTGKTTERVEWSAQNDPTDWSTDGVAVWLEAPGAPRVAPKPRGRKK